MPIANLSSWNSWEIYRYSDKKKKVVKVWKGITGLNKKKVGLDWDQKIRIATVVIVN